MDLSGPHVFGRGFGVPSATGYRYFLCGVYQPPAGEDGKAQAPWPYVRWLKTKAGPEVLRAVQVIVAAINATHVQKAVFRIHSDRGGEFVNMGLSQWAAEQGIQPTSTEGHDPSGNGQAEAWIGKLKQRAQAMIATAKLDTSLWPFAVSHAALTSRARAQQKDLGNMPVFGKAVYAKLKVPELDDFKPRAVKGIFLGVTEHVANGKAVMYTDTGYIDINSAIYEAVGDLSVETLPAEWQP